MNNEMAVRYGATLQLPVTIDTNDATSVTLIVGKAGQNPEITKTASFTNGSATILLDEADTRIPLGEYQWQLTVAYSDGQTGKYPEPNGFNTELPTFLVLEALDETGVTE